MFVSEIDFVELGRIYDLTRPAIAHFFSFDSALAFLAAHPEFQSRVGGGESWILYPEVRFISQSDFILLKFEVKILGVIRFSGRYGN